MRLRRNMYFTYKYKPKTQKEMIQIDLYKRGEGVLKTFPPLNSVFEAESFIKNYCKDNNVKVVSKEKCDTSYWNYLSDGTEIDYTIS